MDHNDFLIRYVYIPLAALAGSVSSLGAKRWRTMSRTSIALTLFTSFTFAMFVTPWLANEYWHVQEDYARRIVALTYLSAIGAPLLLPWILKRLERLLGSGEGE